VSTTATSSLNAVIDEQIEELIPKLAKADQGESIRIRMRISELKALKEETA
jgi:hypothetical protein